MRSQTEKLETKLDTEFEQNVLAATNLIFNMQNVIFLANSSWSCTIWKIWIHFDWWPTDFCQLPQNKKTKLFNRQADLVDECLKMKYIVFLQLATVKTSHKQATVMMLLEMTQRYGRSTDVSNAALKLLID